MSSALIKDLEEVFKYSEQRVIAAFVAVKCDPAAVTSRGRRALPKSSGKARIVCLTAKRRSQKRGFKGTLHVCKLSQGRYQVRKSVRLKLLTRLEAFIDSPGQQEYLELTFVQRGFTGGETRLAFEVKNALVRLELLGTLYTFCRTHEKRPPQVVGIDISELESSAAQYTKQVAEASVGQTAKVLLNEAVREAPLGAGEGLDGSGLWGQREDKQIESLLEMVSGGAAGMEELQERLETELEALEHASVHEILENGAMVQRVLDELASTLDLLDDLDQNINVFDARLRHMREDIAAIEDRNNQLELHSRNNQKLLGALQSLVGRLALPERAERALQAREVTTTNMTQMVEAAWELHAHLQSLSEQPDGGAAAGPAAGPAAAGQGGAGGDGGANGNGGGGGVPPRGEEGRLPRCMADMAAVTAQRQRLHGLQRGFLEKATNYLQDQLSHVADAAVQRVAALQGAQRLRPVDHSSLRRRAAELAPLLEVVGVMRPAATVAPREAYCKSVNGLLRREVAAAAAELRRSAAQADAGAQQHEPDLLDRAAVTDSASTIERLHSAPALSLTQQQQRRGQHSRMNSYASINLEAAYKGAGMTPVYEGYQALLESHVPLLAEEMQQCISLMFPRALPAPHSAAGGVSGTSNGEPASAGRSAKSVRFAGPGDTLPPLDVSSPEVQSTAASLLAGIDGELLGVIDSVKPHRALLCLPMLGATLAWQQRLAARGPACKPLVDLLVVCQRRLTAQIKGYFSEREAAMQRYDGRSSMSVSGTANVKAQHVLPFIVNFPVVAGRIEDLLDPWLPHQTTQQRQHQQHQQQQQGAGSPGTGSAGAVSGGRTSLSGGGGQLSPLRAQMLAPSPFESSVGVRPTATDTTVSDVTSSFTYSHAMASETSELSFMESDADSASSRRVTTDPSLEAPASARQAGAAPPQAAATAAAGQAQALVAAGGAPPTAQQPAGGQQQQQAPGEVLRELVDAGYEGWVRAMTAAVEAVGASDAKHGVRLRLENCAFLQLGLQTLPLSHTQVLEAFAAQVAALKDRFMAGYIEQQVEYFKFTRVLEFSRKLDEVLGSVGREEVHFQLHFQPQEVRQLLSSTSAGLDKKLVAVRQRILKHLAATSPYLVEQVWDKLEGICLSRWSRMEQQLRLCYKGIELRPPLPELRRMFQAAKQHQ